MDENHCRACCEELKNFQKLLFDREDGEDIREKLHFVTGVKIESFDQFSKSLCIRCFDDTITAYDLKTRCLETEKRLISLDVLDILQSENQIDMVVVKAEPNFEDIVIKTEMIEYDEPDSFSNIRIDVKKSKKKASTRAKAVKSKRAIVSTEIFRCNDCGYSTKVSKSLESHLQTAHINGFQCENCNKRFQTVKNLEAHVKSNCTTDVSTSNLNFQCSDCGYSTLRKRDYTIHMTQEHQSKMFRCVSCKESFSFNFLLSNHRQSHHPDDLDEHELEEIEKKKKKLATMQRLVSCELCGKCMKSYKLSIHKTRHHKSNSLNFECDACGKVFNEKKKISQHVFCHVPMEFRLFECDLCGGKYSNDSLLQQHLRQVHRRVKRPTTDPIPCNYCGKMSKNQASLKSHIDYVHKKEQLQMPCKRCGKILRNSAALKDHIKIFHTPGGQGNFVCNICGKLYNRLKELNNHIRKVHSEPKHACDFPGCDKKFRDQINVRFHMKTVHMNQRDYSCPYADCGKFYTSKQKVSNHVRLTHEKFKVNCPVGNGCKFAVGRRDYMRHHLAKHKDLSQDDLAKYLASFKEMKLI